MAFIPIYLFILLFTILIDFAAGLWIASSQGARRKQALVVSLIANIGVLAFFKYYNFLVINVNDLAHAIGWNYSLDLLGIILPIGLSFHTFQSMSYTIEVYRGHQPAERNLGIFALYVMFYPQLVAGPIERPQNLLHQFHEPKTFDYDRAVSGLKLMAWGFFKKMVVADTLALYANQIYTSPRSFSGLPLIIATVFFAYQIYCDFSGYSDIARGSARVMGFDLMLNFNRPYIAKSISEFWSRWHISLSTWFKDYLYIPLGGNRVGTPRLCFNLMVTFVISGLWHGANWTYVFWGFLNGFYLVFAMLTKDARTAAARAIGLTHWPKIHNALKILATFALICLSWVFFRAASFSDAWYIITHMFAGMGDWAHQLADKEYLKDNIYLANSGRQFRMAILSILILEAIQSLNQRRSISLWVKEKPAVLRWVIYTTAVLVILNTGAVSELPFIYFQF